MANENLGAVPPTEDLAASLFGDLPDVAPASAPVPEAKLAADLFGDLPDAGPKRPDYDPASVAIGKAGVRGVMQGLPGVIGSGMEHAGRTIDLAETMTPEQKLAVAKRRDPLPDRPLVPELNTAVLPELGPVLTYFFGDETKGRVVISDALGRVARDAANAVGDAFFVKDLTGKDLVDVAKENMLRRGKDLQDFASQWEKDHPEMQVDKDFASRTTFENFLKDPIKTAGVLGAENVPNMAVSVMAYLAAGPGGAFLTSYGLESGDQYQTGKQFLVDKYGSEDKVPVEEWGNLAATTNQVGAINGVLDLVPIADLFKSKGLSKEFAKNLWGEVLRRVSQGGRTAVTELGTETIQEIVQLAGEKTVGKDHTLAEAFDRVFGAAVAAGPVGFVTGSLHGGNRGDGYAGNSFTGEGRKAPEPLPAEEVIGKVEDALFGDLPAAPDAVRQDQPTAASIAPPPAPAAPTAQAEPEASAPAEYIDNRLKRQPFRDMLQRTLNEDFVSGGGVQVIPDVAAVRGESDPRVDINDDRFPKKRTPSLNPPWVQELLADTGLSVDQVRNAADKAMAGKRLGVRQADVVSRLLDRITDDRTSAPAIDYARKQIDDARAVRAQLHRDLASMSEVEALAEGAPEIAQAGELYSEQEYAPEQDGLQRILTEQAQQAREAGVDPDRVTDILSGQKPDAEVLRDLIIETERARYGRGQEGEGRENRGPQRGPQGGDQEVPGRRGQGPQPRTPEAEGFGLAQPQGQVSPPPARAPRAPAQGDLLGNAPSPTRQALHDEIARIKARHAASPPVESGDGALFDGSAKQTDIADLAPAERRHDAATRKRVADMTEAEKLDALLRDHKTGLFNERAYQDEHERLPVQVAVDADSLKWVNDNMGHESGDKLLRAIADAMRRHAPWAYRLGGDEFVIQARTEAEARDQVDRIAATLQAAVVDAKLPDGSIIEKQGVGFSHGIGSDLKQADGRLYDSKRERESAGLRAGRGQEPPGVVRKPAAGGNPAVRQAAEEVNPNAVSKVDVAAHEAATSPLNDLAEPTDAQKDSGNYRKGHITLHGLDIAIENPEGAVRRGVDRNGKPWSVTMRHHYGYIKGTVGKDKDHIDVFLGPGAQDASLPVFVIDQNDPGTGRFDEHKVMLGFPDEKSAREGYLANYDKGWKGLGRITRLSLDEFKAWLADGDTRKPVADYAKQRGEAVGVAAPAKSAIAGEIEKLKRRQRAPLHTFPESPTGAEISASGVQLPPGVAEIVARDGIRFGRGKSPLTKNKWAVFSEDGAMLSNWRETQEAARTEAEREDEILRQGKAVSERQETLEKDIGRRLLAGETPTDADITALDLRPVADFRWLSPVVQRLFGISKAKARESMGDTLKPYHTDMGAEYWQANAKRALMSAAAYVGKKPTTKVADLQKEAGAKPSKQPAKPEMAAAVEGDVAVAPADGALDATSLLARHEDFVKRLHDGDVSEAEFKQQFEDVVTSEQDITTELAGLTKEALLKRGGAMFAHRYKNDKKDAVVRALYDDMVTDFNLGGSLSFSVGRGYQASMIAAVRRRVDTITPEALAEYADDVKASRAEREARVAGMMEAVKDPKTLEDFETFLRVKKRADLTTEQRARYDELKAEKTRSERKARTSQDRTTVGAAGATTGAEIIATKHTKKGYDLFVVQAAERVEREVYNAWNAAAKKLGGWYSGFRGAGAVPGFQFKTREAAEAFQKYVSGGDTTAVQEQAQARRDAFEDDRSQTAVERLREMADRLEERADESLGRERKTNTERRARMAASAEAEANHQKALATTMRNIAAGIESGGTKFLDQVRQKVQVEMLNSFLDGAKYRELRELYKDSYTDYEKHRHDKPTLGTVEYAVFPTYTAYRSDLARLGRELIEIDGLRQIGQRILKVANDITAAYTKFAKDNLDTVSTFATQDGTRPVFPTGSAADAAIARSGYAGKAVSVPIKRGQHMIVMSPAEARRRGIWEGDDDKRITLVPELGAEIAEKANQRTRNQGISSLHQFEGIHGKLKRLAAMGIETPAEFRAALREFVGLRDTPAAPDKIKEMERAMIGRRKDGLDFFPTPDSVADQMIEAAGIEAGMSVLEPSAGMGHIADRIREAGFEPDVVELSGDRRELLEAKGYTVVGRDFMEMSPRESFTYGDTFKAPDGNVGIMRGHPGGPWGGRVVLRDKNGTQLGFYDRNELEPVQKNGTESGYDRIIMNPPFSDRRDMKHVQHAYGLLRPGGRLVAIMGEGVFFGSDKAATEFRDWLERVGGTDEKLEEGSFRDPSLPVTTAANARMVVIEKDQEAGNEPADLRLSRGPAGPSTLGADYAANVDQTLDAAKPQSDAVIMGPTPAVLRLVGVPELALVTTGDVIDKMHYDHGLSRQQIKRLPEMLADPVMVFESDSRPGSFVVVLDDGFRGKPLLAAVHPDRIMGRAKSNLLASVYAKDNAVQIAKWGRAGLLRYVNKKRSPAWQTTFGVQFPWVGPAGRGSEKRIYTEADLVKTGPVTSRGDSGSYRKGRDTSAGMAAADVRAVIDTVDKRMRGKLGVSVVESVADLPRYIRDELRALGAEGDAKGLYDDKSRHVWLMANRLRDLDDAQSTLFHEMVHAGLRRVFGDKEMRGLLNRVYLRYGNSGLQKIADEYGLDLSNAEHRLLAAEEKLAQIGESGQEPQLWQRFVALVREWLYRHGFRPEWIARLTDNDIQVAVANAVRAARKGGSQRGDGLRLSVSRQEDGQGDGQGTKVSDLTGDVQDGQKSLLDGAKAGQPLDRLLRIPFHVIGTVDDRGVWYAPKVARDTMARALDAAGTVYDQHMGWMHPLVATAKAGLIDRYGLSKEYRERDLAREADKRKIMLQAADILKTLEQRGVDAAEAKVLQAVLNGEQIAEGDWKQIAEPIRKAIDEMGQEAVMLGLLSEEAYQKNRGTYLHRVYLKHEADDSSLGKFGDRVLSTRRKRIVGNELKGRGMSLKVGQDALLRLVPAGWWGRSSPQGKTDKSLQGAKFVVLDRVKESGAGVDTIEGVPKKPGKSRTVERVYWPADVAMPAKYQGWTNRGTWEVRDAGGQQVTLWRDFTKAERTNMGEILDARYTIAKTFQLLAHDLSTGRFLRDIAANDAWTWSRGGEPEGWVEPRRAYSTYADAEWVKVPADEIPGTQGKKRWGALAGKFVRAEIWRDLNEMERMQVPGLWKSLLTQWKLNKVARNPVVHVNNVMSNVLLMDMADVRIQDLWRGVASWINRDEHYRDAWEHGAFGGSFIEADIKREVFEPILKKIAEQAQGGQGSLEAGGLFGLKMKGVGSILDGLWSILRTADNKMLDYYQAEDEWFRMATYMRRLSLGDTPAEAARTARDQFLNYDIRAPWVNAARNTFLPFISYTYRAVPVIAKSIAQRPWKLAKYAIVAHMVNALGYMLAPGDEDEERRLMREDVQGDTWLPGVPRLVRMPWRDANGNPVFLDVRRWIPAGDVFDFNQHETPVPAPLQFGGPLMLAAEFALNKVAFTGKEIVNWKTADAVDAAKAYGNWLYKSWMPSAPWIPGSWYWDKIWTAYDGGRDTLGRDYDLPSAVASSIGVKLAPQDTRVNKAYRGQEFEQIQRALVFELGQLADDRRRNLIGEEEYLRQVEDRKAKLKRLTERAAEVFQGSKE